MNNLLRLKIKLFYYELIRKKNKIKKYKDKIDIYNKRILESESLSLKKYSNKMRALKKVKLLEENNDYILTCFIVTHNHEKTIARCIESILNQKTDFKYLIKILDDNSQDKTFDICLDYLRKRPDKFRIITQKINSSGKHITAALRKINTEYFCIIDGDDYWCNENKIQKAVNYLEKNKDVVMYVHDTGVIVNNNIKSLINDLNKINVKKNCLFDFNSIIDSHLSGRIYRNIIDFRKDFVTVKKRDGILNEIWLSKGKAYFDRTIMSVYDTRTGGVWNSLSENQKRYSKIYRCYNSNKILGYKFDKIFTNKYNVNFVKIFKFLIGKKIAWAIYVYIKRCICEIKEIMLIHRKFNDIENGHRNFTKKDMRFIEGISEDL